MFRILNIVLILAVIVGAAVVYNMKHNAENAADRVAHLQRAIEQEEDKIDLLKAEWSVLNQPARLQRLVERYNAYLHLEPLQVKQIASINDLPTKPIQFTPFSNDPLGGYAARGTVIR
ncbi:hypothetical protein C8N35_109119 [Breoghania corrubedonensis]|uniref:Cell division protein FtsL n=1 Tax=Breoghania corrubedonensis TaxID=665038 RepID=A0A2T5V4Y4_9HYPH|nr:hypothetical protein [Breoghania corrubedonensis]PTW58815.1 hypothetical protein C8N35_109119 [Breoghania corrubedonensis]